MEYEYSCPECEQVSKFEVEKLVRGRYSGPPEKCYPDEGGVVDGPQNCPNCDFVFDFDEIVTALDEETFDPPDHNCDD